MASIPETDLARIARYCETRVPARLRNEARVEMVVRGRSVTIYDCRPPWHPNSTVWSRARVAQFRYDPSSQLWSVYYADRNGRWHPYLNTEPGTAAHLLEAISADATGIFWG